MKINILLCLSFFIVYAVHALHGQVKGAPKQVASQLVSKKNQEWFGVLYSGDINKLKKLVAHGIDINTTDADGRTLLMCAACADFDRPYNKDIVMFLLQQPNIAVTAKNKWGQSALSYAAAGHTNDILEALLKSPGVNINEQDTQGNTPLMAAVISTTPERVKRLLEVPGINVSLKNKAGKTALDIATQCAKNNPNDRQDQEILKYLTEYRKKA